MGLWQPGQPELVFRGCAGALGGSTALCGGRGDAEILAVSALPAASPVKGTACCSGHTGQSAGTAGLGLSCRSCCFPVLQGVALCPQPSAEPAAGFA